MDKRLPGGKDSPESGPSTVALYPLIIYPLQDKRLPGGKDSPESGSLYSDYESGQQYEQVLSYNHLHLSMASKPINELVLSYTEKLCIISY